MSGEAGSTLTGEYYALFVGTGVNVSVAIPPGDDGSAVGKYFERASAPFHRWLERARPQLDALFAQLATELPLVRLSEPSQTIDGIVIKDGEDEDDDRHFRRYYRGKPCPVYLQGGRRLPDFKTLNLNLAVSTRIKQSRLEPVLDRVAAILLATQADPPPPPEPTPPPPAPPPPSLLARSLDWLRRRF